jgi:uncharacterized protein YndB with AHSA1/START domain
VKRFLALLLCASPVAARADIADSSPNGFTVKFSATLRPPPAEVYQRIVRVAEWWDSGHTFSGDSHNLSIDARAGGCFCEKLPDGGFVRHLEVVFAWPGKLLRLYGGLGPLQGIAAAGPMTFQLKPEQAGTRLDLTYSVSGYGPQGVASWAGPVNEVLGAQFARLKSYVETGSAPPNPASSPKKDTTGAR